MKLSTYLELNDLSHEEFSKKIFVTATAVRRYSSGARIPRLDVMDRIAKETGGTVTANDFFGHAGDVA